MFSARAIALSGIGFAAALVAVQGLGPVDQQIINPPAITSTAPVYGGGSTKQADQEIDLVAQEDDEILAVIMAAVTSGALG